MGEGDRLPVAYGSDGAEGDGLPAALRALADRRSRLFRREPTGTGLSARADEERHCQLGRRDSMGTDRTSFDGAVEQIGEAYARLEGVLEESPAPPGQALTRTHTSGWFAAPLHADRDRHIGFLVPRHILDRFGQLVGRTGIRLLHPPDGVRSLPLPSSLGHTNCSAHLADVGVQVWPLIAAYRPWPTCRPGLCRPRSRRHCFALPPA